MKGHFRFRNYYEDQLELITSVEDILLPKDGTATDHATAYEKHHRRTIKILTNSTLIINIVRRFVFDRFLSYGSPFFMTVSCDHQNRWCSHIKITFGHFLSRR